MLKQETIKQTKEGEILIGENYKLFSKRKLGSGAFGDIYYGLNLIKNEEVAIKLEPSNIKNSQLLSESKLYHTIEGGEGIPRIYYYGTQGKYNLMIMDLLGKSLEDLFSSCDRRFSLKTTVIIGKQMLDRIEYIHSKLFIHRDIKPDNFVMGSTKYKETVYIIDFGLGKRYKDPRTGLHIPYREGKSLTGTARYASISTHIGIEQSRRDDLESFTYVLVYFLKGSLPWQGLKAKNNKEKYEKITEKKVNTKLSILCRDLPDEFIQIINYARGLKFDEKPDYEYIRKRLVAIAERENFGFDDKYDWSVYENKNTEQNNEKESICINKEFTSKCILKTNEANNMKVIHHKECKIYV